MITYELALKLKEAGFPGIEFESSGFPMFSSIKKAPTLSELIEACGDAFINLTRDYSGWCTNFVAGINDESYDGYETYGSTPEESVAKLWLVLNNK